MRTLLFFALLAAAAACSSEENPGKASSGSSEEPDGGTMRLDASVLGTSCIGSDDCSDGGICVEYTGFDVDAGGPRCIPKQEPCGLVTCPDGYICLSNPSEPPIVFCGRRP